MSFLRTQISFLLAAGALLLCFVYLWFSGNKDAGVFVGL